MFFKLKTSIRRWASKTIARDHPASYPYVTGDGFRAIAQHIYDEGSNFIPENVQSGDIIFVRTDFLESFFKKKSPDIKNRYVLITHNEDTEITEAHAKYIDGKINPKMIHWFAQNATIKNDKVSPLPIGLENYRFIKSGSDRNIGKARSLHSVPVPKISLTFGASNPTNPERALAHEILSKSPVGLTIEWIADRNEYYEKIKNAMFIASPRGAGLDCHRTWEALYLGIIPVCLKNSLTEYFVSEGIPILTIDSWEDIHNMTEQDLIAFYEKEKIKFNNDSLSAYYWLKKITKFHA